MTAAPLKGRLSGAAAALFLLLASSKVDAACLACTCSMSTTGLTFGAYSPLAATPADVTGSIRVQCSLLGLAALIVAYTIELSPGNSGTFSDRTMTGTGGTLRYNLYTTPQRTTVWGNGANGALPLSDSYLLGLLGVTRDYTVHGRIPAGQAVRPGTYMDSLIVTLSY